MCIISSKVLVFEMSGFIYLAGGFSEDAYRRFSRRIMRVSSQRVVPLPIDFDTSRAFTRFRLKGLKLPVFAVIDTLETDPSVQSSLFKRLDIPDFFLPSESR